MGCLTMALAATLFRMTACFNGANLENNVFTKFTTIPTLVYASTDDGILEGGLLSLNKGPVSDGDVPERFYYNFDCSGIPSTETPWVKDAHVERKVEYTNCANLLQQTTIQVATKYDIRLPIVSRPIVPVSQSITWNGYTIVNDNPGDPVYRLSRCCTPSGCPEKCLKNANGKRCMLNIRALEIEATWMSAEQGFRDTFTQGGSVFGYLMKGGDYKNRRAVSRLVMRTPCEYCPLTNCVTNCTNGEFATGYSDYQDGFQTKRVECRPCAPGTWNTCVGKTSCVWNIPSWGNERQGSTGGDIYPIPGGPVESCYGCDLVSTYKYHFVGTSKEVRVNASSWKCPGGKSAPENCPSTAFERSANGSECVCRPGYYQSPTQADACIPCPAGSMCPNGVLEKCPIHYYQVSTGKTSCEQCSTTGDANGYFNYCLVRGQQLQYCDPAVANSQNAPLTQLCVPCNQCRRPYTQAVEDPNLKNCYRGG